ncbi:restriction endonuclease subunit M [Bacteroidia bacterium]|nr:restriction endonuclease subunit M [Bacteroidia bacterium]
MTLIELGIQKKLISFDDERKMITYLYQNKKRNYNNPEEKVQAETFLSLVLTYNYPVNRIRQFVSVQMGSETKEADIIVYDDDKLESPLIVIECKKEEISDQEFETAVNQAYSYAVAEGAKFVWTTSHIKNQYCEIPDKKPKSRLEIPNIPQFGQKELAPYNFVKGANSQSKKSKEKFFELEKVEESELVRVFAQAHQVLWGGGKRNESEAFDEFDKLLFCKIWDEKETEIDTPYAFQIYLNETEEDLFNRVEKIYNKGKAQDPNVFKGGIGVTKHELLNIVQYLQRLNLLDTDLDSKGKAFETFMGDLFRGRFGAFFTPRPIVRFIVDCLPIEHDSKVLDTSCGSGGFLLYAMDKVRQQAKERFPNDYNNYFKYWHDFAAKKLFGIEINEQIARTAKMNMIIHDDGHTNVISSDGLVSAAELQKQNNDFEYETFDFIITNPPFGSSIKQTEKAYLSLYNLGTKETDWLDIKYAVNQPKTTRDTQSTEVLFIEQCHKFLTEKGYLAIVIPDGILTNSSLQYVRDNIEEMYRIVAVVSMPQTAFAATGAGVKSSVLFLRKHKQKTSEKISAKKLNLKEKIKTDNQYIAIVEKWEKEKNEAIKALEKVAKLQNPNANKKEIAEIIKDDKTKVQQEFTEKVNLLKEDLTEKYFTAKQKALDDYPIFMAIAEDIGYDATGRPTAQNELIEIGEELARFIEWINENEY